MPPHSSQNAFSMTEDLFAPYTALAVQLLPFATPETTDGAHDIAHITRVWKNVQSTSQVENGDLEVLAAATLLHDCVSVEKNSPDRPKASALASDAARTHLATLGWAKKRIDQTCHAIAAHSFSAGIPPSALRRKSYKMPTVWAP